MEHVTFNLTKDNYLPRPLFKNGEIIERGEGSIIKFPKYHIVVNVESKSLGEDSITLRPLSKYWLIRKVQVFFIKIKLKP